MHGITTKRKLVRASIVIIVIIMLWSPHNFPSFLASVLI